MSNVQQSYQRQPMSKPVLLAMTVITGLTFLFGGMTAGGLGFEHELVAIVGACGTLATSAASAAIGFYLANTNTANTEVVEFAADNTVYAGQANEISTGLEVRKLGR